MMTKTKMIETVFMRRHGLEWFRDRRKSPQCANTGHTTGGEENRSDQIAAILLIKRKSSYFLNRRWRRKKDRHECSWEVDQLNRHVIQQMEAVVCGRPRLCSGQRLRSRNGSRYATTPFAFARALDALWRSALSCREDTLGRAQQNTE